MFFYLSKVLWFFADPGNILFFGIFVSCLSVWMKWYRFAKFLTTTMTVCVLAVTLFPTGKIVINHLENRFPNVTSLPQNIDGIIVIGGVVNQFMTKSRGQIAINGAVERMTEFARLSKLYPKAKLVLSGGSGILGNQTLKEADFVDPLLLSLNINPNSVLFERESRNTAENASFTKKLVNPTPKQRWLIITSAFHMPRTIAVFRKQEWNVLAYPVDYLTDPKIELGVGFNFMQNLNMFSLALHECLGLTFYWLTGRTNELFPKPYI